MAGPHTFGVDLHTAELGHSVLFASPEHYQRFCDSNQLPLTIGRHHDGTAASCLMLFTNTWDITAVNGVIEFTVTPMLQNDIVMTVGNINGGNTVISSVPGAIISNWACWRPGGRCVRIRPTQAQDYTGGQGVANCEIPPQPVAGGPVSYASLCQLTDSRKFTAIEGCHMVLAHQSSNVPLILNSTYTTAGAASVYQNVVPWQYTFDPDCFQSTEDQRAYLGNEQYQYVNVANNVDNVFVYDLTFTARMALSNLIDTSGGALNGKFGTLEDVHWVEFVPLNQAYSVVPLAIPSLPHVPGKNAEHTNSIWKEAASNSMSWVAQHWREIGQVGAKFAVGGFHMAERALPFAAGLMM